MWELQLQKDPDLRKVPNPGLFCLSHNASGYVATNHNSGSILLQLIHPFRLIL